MKRAPLSISILLNVALAGIVCVLVALPRQHRPSAIAEQAVSKGETGSNQTQHQQVSGPAAAQESIATRFDWRQIESTNYRTYVANLRGIGCPEQTIRDIITADVHGLLAEKHKGSSQDFSTEETGLVTVLLGGSMPTPSSPPARSARAGADSISLPLVLREVPASMNLDEQQLTVLRDLRQRFQEELGSGPAGPDDLGYRERWRRAQNNSDDLLAGMLGGEFYLQYQLQVSGD